MKIPNECGLQPFVFIYSSGIDWYDFMRILRRCTNKPYFLSVIDTTLPSDHSLRLRWNLKVDISQETHHRCR